MKDDRITIHFIDLSDHFQHQDKSITRINFLRYSDEDWQKIAGNEFAYCNRLRVSDYLTVFEELGFAVCRYEIQEDDEGRECTTDGFAVNDKFFEYGIDDLFITQLKVVLKVGGKAGRGI